MMEDLILRAAKDISRAKHVVALTGAGISTESGIPPFRGKGGLWEKYDPMEIAHIDTFNSDPARVWNILIKDMRTYYLKPPNISWGLIFPLAWTGMFFIRSGSGLESIAAPKARFTARPSDFAAMDVEDVLHIQEQRLVHLLAEFVQRFPMSR